jgi:hypothetical protein
MSDGRTPPEHEHDVSIGREIQSNLCVSKSKSFDDTTRAAIKQAKLGQHKAARANDCSTIPTTRSTASLKLPQSVCRDCTVDKTGTDRLYSKRIREVCLPDWSRNSFAAKTACACAFPDLKDKFSGNSIR